MDLTQEPTQLLKVILTVLVVRLAMRPILGRATGLYDIMTSLATLMNTMRIPVNHPTVGTILAVLIALTWLLFTSPVVVAQEEQHCSNWQPINPGLLVIDCAFGTALQRITVFDKNRNGAPDYDSDTWLFDVGRDGTVQLIVHFEMTSNGRVAYLFDDRNGDGSVSFNLHEEGIDVLESPHWTVRADVAEDWWLPGGHLNYRLKFTVDGAQRAIYGTDLVQQIVTNDGLPDWSYQVYDEQSDGTPDYWVFHLLTTIPRSWNITRFSLFENIGQTAPTVPPSRPFWPFLSLVQEDEVRMFDVAPRILVDWEKGKIVTVGFPGYPIEEGLWINSHAPATAGQFSNPNFENPHAWYDLAQDNDNNPELNARVIHWKIDDSNWLNTRHPVNEIRYSWNQSNAPGLSFDYKLGLVGTMDFGSSSRIGPYELNTIPWAELPSWVVEQKWQTATFIAVEGRDYQSSEGIYEWGPATSADLSAEAFVTGFSSVYPEDQQLHDLSPGIRGEFALDLGDSPRLYLSAVDRKLHLFGAEKGWWNLDGSSEIRMHNLDEDAYIDQWILIAKPDASNTITRTTQLNVAPGYLVFGGDGQVFIRQSTFEQSLFETLPPRNHDEWSDLGNKLDTNQPTFAPGDFRAMMAQFPGPEMHISSARMLGYRPTAGEGFRFVLDVQSGYSIDGDDLLGLAGLDAGQYAVSFSKGEFLVEPLTPPDLALVVGASEDLNASELQRLTVQWSNAGLQDAKDLTLVATAQHGDEVQEVARLTVDALAQETSRLALSWQPTASGEWMLTYRLEMADGQVLAEAQQPVTVRTQQASGLLGDVWLTSSPGWRLPAALLLALLAFCSGGAVYLRWQRQTMEGRA